MTKSLKLSLTAGAALLGVYALLRLAFLGFHAAYFAGTTPAEVALAFVHGLRFDVAALVLLNAPALVLLNMPLPTVKPRWMKRLAFGCFAVLNTVGFLLNLVDLGYYPMVQRRTMHEAFFSPGHLATNFVNWVETWPALVGGALAALAGLLLLMAWFARRLDRRFAETPGWIRSHVCGLLLLAACVIGVRGGLQAAPMRPADAFVHSRSQPVGDLTLNTSYTVILSAVLPQFPRVRKLPEEEARRIVRGMLQAPGEVFDDLQYPFARRAQPDGPAQRLNVVVLIQESWTFAHVGAGPDGASRTPVFDALAKEGALYVNFLANAQRSSEAVPAVLASIPSIFPRPIIGSAAELVRLRGLGDVLADFGYQSSFLYGATPTVEGFEGFLSRIGFSSYVSRDDYQGEEPDSERTDGRWGIYDHLFYAEAARRMDRMSEPFAAVLFGLSPHDPYHLPPSFASVISAHPDESPYQHGLRFSDHALGLFFEHARAQPWFARTVFLITADHTRFAPPASLYESFHVPLLIYAPGRVEPQVRDDIGSHADMLPTIVDLLKLPARHASFGRSLLPRDGGRTAVVQRSGLYTIFGEHYALQHDLVRDRGLFAYRTDRRFERDLASEQPEIVQALRTRLFAWVQALTGVLADERLWPPSPGPR